MTKCLQESRMREIRTSGLTRGSNGIGASRPLLSTLLVKSSLLGNLEFKVKTFCAIPRVLAFLKDYILFAEKERSFRSSPFTSTRWRQWIR